MAQQGFFGDNLYRALPFVQADALPGDLAESAIIDGVYSLPESAVVDFGALLGLTAQYTPGTDVVYLYRVHNTGAAIEFEFRTTAAGAASTSLLFSFNVTAAEFTSQFADAGDHPGSSGSSSSLACGDLPVWEGFMVLGRLDELLLLIPASGNAIVFENMCWQIEPARLQSLAHGYVSSVNLANYARTHVLPAAQCSSASADDTEIFVQTACLTGPQVLKEGYNASIRQEDSTNSLIIDGAVGAGAGMACAEVPRYPGESPPAGSSLLTGGPGCTGIIKTINGVGGSVVNLIGGNGVQVSPDQDDPNGLVVQMDLTNFAVCQPPA